MGAAAADTTMATLALFSLGFITSFIENNLMVIKAIGGIAVICVGATILMQNPVIQIRNNRSGRGSSLWSDFLSIFVVTIANPAYILVFVALFATFGVTNEGRFLGSMLMIVGVAIGAGIWWASLTAAINAIRNRFRPRHLLYINRVAGSVIVALGLASILSMFINTI